jgi:hypothetical protein
VYTFEEARRHSERNDCWLVISGKVSVPSTRTVAPLLPFHDKHGKQERFSLASGLVTPYAAALLSSGV